MKEKIQTKASRIIISLLLTMFVWSAFSTPPVIAQEGMELVAPHIGYGDGWWTELAVLNIGEANTVVTFYAYDNEGSQIGTAKNITLLANQNYVKDVADLFPDVLSPEDIASMRIVSHSSFLTGLLTYGKTNTTQLAGLPLLPATSSILYVPHVEVNNPWWTGIGVMNAGDSETEISLSLFSNERLIKTISKTLKPNQRLVGKISYSELFGNYNYTQGRYLIIESANSQPISGMFIVSTDDDTTYMGDSMQVIPGTGSAEPLGAPENITATPVGNGQVKISWDEVAGADNYILYYGASGTSANYVEPVESTSYTAENLTSGTTYNVVLKAVQEGEKSNYSFATEPVNVQATYEEGQAEISWNKVTGADYYNIYWSNKTGVTQNNHDNKKENISFADLPYTISGLEDGETYYLVVTAVGSGGESNESEEVVISTSSFPDTYTNALGMDFKLIDAGIFTMGSPVNEPGRGTDETQRQVTLSQFFYIQTTEVTRKQWKDLMGTGPSRSTCNGADDECPVDYVSWENIQSFLTKLNDMETEEGEYRLPSEEEWEYAARAGTTTAFANGGITETEGCSEVDSNLNSMGWYCGNAQQKVHQVKRKQANDWGLFDMHGNVWELCQDESSSLVIRGGCWGCYASQCRSAEREKFYSVSSIIGFRVVWIPEKPMPPEKPVAPQNLSVFPGNSKVMISWDKVVNADSYNVYYRAYISPNLNTNSYDGVITEITDNSYSVTGLTNDKKYYFVVTAVNSEGESDASEVKSATPDVIVVLIPEAPANVWAVPPTGGQVTISWDMVGGDASYNIYYATRSGVRKSNYSSLPGGTQKRSVSNPYTVTSLTNDTKYYFVVTAVNSSGESNESAQVSAKPVDMTPYKNSLGMTFVPIPPGTYMMGSPVNEPGRDADETLRQTTLTTPFYIQSTEVRQKTWISVMGDNPSWFDYWSGDYPVESAAMSDIQAFISKMNVRGEGVYRLPTEAEWEYAARAGTRTAIANGDLTAEDCNHDPNLDAIGWYCGNRGDLVGRTNLVGKKESNDWDLYDMHGNVWEICQDLYGSSTDYYVKRGGSAFNKTEECRSANRKSHSATDHNYSTGLRLVLERN
ncbi:MAG: SUMF1/EgtB/PvdO family nonheme iron enzyme [Desulfobacteraceae bacterium]|nr:SUMF1/EgtB/PvdO family nonheme iron enzyme [Desulfobacteraceae bacterium]